MRKKSTVRFETTSLPLASSLLCQIPDATLLEVAASPSIDGKRLIVIVYPADQVQAFQGVIDKFLSRSLVVPLYEYNRALNTVRDQLKGGRRHVL